MTLLRAPRYANAERGVTSSPTLAISRRGANRQCDGFKRCQSQLGFAGAPLGQGHPISRMLPSDASAGWQSFKGRQVLGDDVEGLPINRVDRHLRSTE